MYLLVLAYVHSNCPNGNASMFPAVEDSFPLITPLIVCPLSLSAMNSVSFFTPRTA